MRYVIYTTDGKINLTADLDEMEAGIFQKSIDNPNLHWVDVRMDLGNDYDVTRFFVQNVCRIDKIVNSQKVL